jgi:lipoate-protein ligase A
MPQDAPRDGASDALRVELILDDAVPGHINMARDEWLLEQARPTVRLYGWAPACVSLGRTQSPAEVDTEEAARRGIDVVARKTGGGAILHNEVEVTYAVVLPLDWPGLPGGILESYKFISGPVLETFRSLGVDASFGEGKGGRDTLCYLREEGVSIFVDGRKVSGGAQRRTGRAVLQHGTLVLRLDAERTAAVLRAPVEAIERKVAGLDVLGVDVSREDVVARLAAAFKAAWPGLVEVPSPWADIPAGSAALVAGPF